MLYLDKVPANLRPAFERKLQSISNFLGIYPDWLMWLMNHESGVNAQAVYKAPGDSTDAFTRAKNRATGLIGFMPSTAKSLGTTTQDLWLMNEVEQLDYVKKYFQSFAGKIKSVYDLGKIAFFPLMLGKPRSWEVAGGGMTAQTVRNWNPGFDLNKDGVITVGEYEDYFIKKGVPGILQAAGTPDRISGGSALVKSNKTWLYVGITAGSLVLLYAGYKYYKNHKTK